MNIAILNVIVFGTLFLYFHKTKKNNLIQFITAEFLISAVCGIIHASSKENTYYNLSLEGSIIIYSFFIISIYPIYKYRGCNSFISNNKIIELINKILLICSIYPFVISLIKIGNLLSSGNWINYLSNMHDARFSSSGIMEVSDSIYNLCIKAASWCKNILPLLLIYNLQKYKKINKYTVGIILSQLTLIIDSILTSTRFAIVDAMLSYVFTYYIVSNSISGMAKSISFKIVKYLSIAIISALLIVTIGRSITMGNKDFKSSIEWIALYGGEGMLNFNEYLIDQKITKGVDEIFPYLTSKEEITKQNKLDKASEKNEWSLLTGKPENVFYTSYGSFVDSFGLKITYIILIITAICFSLVINKRRNYMSNMALIILYSRFIFMGFMYFPYYGVNGNKYLIQSLFIVILLYISEKYERRKTIKQ